MSSKSLPKLGFICNLKQLLVKLTIELADNYEMIEANNFN